MLDASMRLMEPSLACDIVWAESGTRAREVVKRSNARVTGKRPSWKVGRMIHWESAIERDAFVLLDTALEVTDFREQPCTITFALEGRKHTHFPDIFIKTKCGDGFIEVKPDKKVNDTDLQARTNFLQLALITQGYFYRVWFEHEIRRQPYFQNAQFLSRNALRMRLDFFERERLRKRIAESGGVTLGSLRSGALGEWALQNACRMIQEGCLTIDMYSHWDEDTYVVAVE